MFHPNKEVIMKSAKVILFAILVFMVQASFASRMVKSKLGNIDITAQKSGNAVVCTVDFNEELTVITESDTDVFVKGRCGKGWVPKSKVELVAKPEGDKTIKFTEYTVQGWVDNLTAIDIFVDNIDDFDGVKIDRDFREYLTYTIDREQTEMRHGEN